MGLIVRIDTVQMKVIAQIVHGKWLVIQFVPHERLAWFIGGVVENDGIVSKYKTSLNATIRNHVL